MRKKMKQDDFKKLIVIPTLVYLSSYDKRMHNKGSEDLLCGTSIVESSLTHTKQIGGVALSLFQVEPNTLTDIYKSYLYYRTDLKQLIDGLLWGEATDQNRLRNLEINQHYACAIARLVYWRSPMSVPQFNGEDIYLYATELAYMHKKAYNTDLGKTNLDHSTNIFLNLVAKSK